MTTIDAEKLPAPLNNIEEPSKRVRVYKYGLLRPTVNAELVEQQMRNAHRYRNTLTEIERGRRAALRESMSAAGDIAALEKAVRDADAALDAVLLDMHRTRAKTRSRSDTPDQKAAVKQARAVRSEAKRNLFAARKVVREDAAIVQRRDEIKLKANELHRSARAHSNTYWGSYLLVEDAMQAASKAPLYDGAGPNDPRFVRWDGEGSVGVQIQGGLASKDAFGDDTRFRIAPVSETAWYGATRGERRHAQYTKLAIRVGSDGRDPIWAEWPMLMHRPLPEGSVIKEARVRRKLVGPRERWEVTLTLDVSATRPAEHPPSDKTIAIDVGWRLIDNALRVASWVDSDGNRGELRLPNDFRTALDKVNELRGLRDTKFNDARAALAMWLDTHKIPEWLRVRTQYMLQWRSASRLAALARAWRDSRFDGDEEGYVALEAWRYKDHHLWSWETSQRNKSLGQRRDIYRIFAAQIATKYGTIVLEEFDLRVFAERVVPESEKAENETARSNRQRASVSELRGAIENAVSSRGRRLERKSAVNTTRECTACHNVEVFDAASVIVATCSQCGVPQDQDDRAAENLLERHLIDERSGDGESDGGARGDGKNKETEGIKESRWEKAKRMKMEREARMATAREPADNVAE